MYNVKRSVTSTEPNDSRNGKCDIDCINAENFAIHVFLYSNHAMNGNTFIFYILNEKPHYSNHGQQLDRSRGVGKRGGATFY